jgi:folate-binding protein YgfZ
MAVSCGSVGDVMQPATGERAEDRALLGLAGADALRFLQGLVTNDLRPLGMAEGIVWAALLTPQGKYLVDFLVVNTGSMLLIDVKARFAAGLVKRLALYRLRADVRFAPLDLPVARGLGAAPLGALADPRHAALGWRRYGGPPGGDPQIDWDAIRVAHMIPETGIELIPDESYILENRFEALHGVDFRKGCYVGQEVTARMKHKTELRKGLVRVHIAGDAGPGADITAAERPVGRLCTRSGDRALAHLRLDRAADGLRAAAARIVLDGSGTG